MPRPHDSERYELSDAEKRDLIKLIEEGKLAKRRGIIHEVDRRGIIATPSTSSINELVVEAACMSILSDGEPVRILYGDHPRVGARRAR